MLKGIVIFFICAGLLWYRLTRNSSPVPEQQAKSCRDYYNEEFVYIRELIIDNPEALRNETNLALKHFKALYEIARHPEHLSADASRDACIAIRNLATLFEGDAVAETIYGKLRLSDAIIQKIQKGAYDIDDDLMAFIKDEAAQMTAIMNKFVEVVENGQLPVSSLSRSNILLAEDFCRRHILLDGKGHLHLTFKELEKARNTKSYKNIRTILQSN